MREHERLTGRRWIADEPQSSAHARIPAAALAVVVAGVAAALHLGKLPPAVPALQAAWASGWSGGLPAVAGAGGGHDARAWWSAWRPTRIGLAPQHAGRPGRDHLRERARRRWSAAGRRRAGLPWLLALRALEGVGFLLAVMPGPGLIRAMVAARRGEGGAGPVGRLHAARRGAGAAARAGADRVRRLAGLVVGAAAVSAAAAAWVALAVPADDARRAAASPQRELVDAPAQTLSVRAGRGRWRWPSRCIRRNGWR